MQSLNQFHCIRLGYLYVILCKYSLPVPYLCQTAHKHQRLVPFALSDFDPIPYILPAAPGRGILLPAVL